MKGWLVVGLLVRPTWSAPVRRPRRVS